MKKNWLTVLIVIGIVTAMYFIEISKVDSGGVNSMPTLDDLHTDEVSKNWEPFYKVRATLIDGQSARFSIPKEITNKNGKDIKLTGAVVFRGNGCEVVNHDTTIVNYFFLLPSLGLAQACVLQPDVAMRWTVRVNLDNSWVLNRTEMIDAEATVSGTLKIDTSKPYEAAFMIENATAELKTVND